MLRFLTAGESHGPVLTAIVEGMPSGIPVDASYIDRELARRQSGYGRGGRMKIETDRVDITAGIRHGLTLGSPVALSIKNRDWDNWKDVMSASSVEAFDSTKNVTRPRPGHADLSGGLKYDHRDLRNILERSSARETAARVAAGTLARKLLEEFGIRIYSWVVEIGGVKWERKSLRDFERLFKKAEASPVRCPDRKAADEMIEAIDNARKAGDSLGGAFEVAATGVPPGLGSHVQWDRKLDGTLAQALMSIQAIKGVEAGLGFGVASTPGSKVHDEIFYRQKEVKAQAGYWPANASFYRKTNNAGGIEGGMSNGEPIILRAAMKPIPTLYKPLRSIDIVSKAPFKASIERSDVCAVPAAAVVAEAVVAFDLARAFLEKFGGDSFTEIERNYKGYLEQISEY
ncbi:MAG: chorismate synthase [Deltaproteobacteria bacterium]|nr:chorismate synthase [Deltaproteobacteria bacterium]